MGFSLYHPDITVCPSFFPHRYALLSCSSSTLKPANVSAAIYTWGKRTLCVNECTGSMWQGASCVCCDRLTSSWIPFALSGILSLLTERTVDSIQRRPHQMKRDSDINLIQNNLDPSCATDFLNLSYDSLFCFLVALLHSTERKAAIFSPCKEPVFVGLFREYCWSPFFPHLLRITFMNVYCTCCVIQLHPISEKTILPFTSNSTPAFHAQNVFHVIAIYPITGAH